MSDKSSLAELVWLLRLKQGMFFEPQTPSEAFSDSCPALAIGFRGGEAESALSVLVKASEWSESPTGDE